MSKGAVAPPPAEQAPDESEHPAETESVAERPEKGARRAGAQPDGARRKRRGGREIPRRLPVLPLINTVVFPRMTVPLLVDMPASVQALRVAEGRGPLILLVAQRQEGLKAVTPADLHTMGTVGQVVQSIRVPNGGMQVVVQGLTRARIGQCVEVAVPALQAPAHEAVPDGAEGDVARDEEGSEPSAYLEAQLEPVTDTGRRTLATEALMRTVLAQLEQLIEKGRGGQPDVLAAARNIEESGWLADVAAFGPDLSVAERQHLLEIEDPTERLRAVSVLLTHQLDIQDLKNKIQSEIQKGMEKTQREYFLREQLKAIHRELGEGDPQQAEQGDLRRLVEAAGMPEEVLTRATRELDRLPQIPPGSPEVGIVRTYIDWLVGLPWSKATDEQLDLTRAMRALNEDHYGLEKVKDRIVEFLAVRRLSGKLRSPILCFVGPPGVGKTSLGRSIAHAMGRKFVRVSLGGVRDEAEIRGHRRTYVGALPGRILRGMRDAEAKNPVFMLDEIDKLGRDFRGDPSSALLEVLDPEQNHSFSDHYLEVPFDLSRVLFITTANLLDPIPPALRDRMEVITIPGYTEEEKVQIARHFVVPRQLEQHGIMPEQLEITDDALRHLIREYTREAGVRNFEREVAHICRKVARRVAEAEGDAVVGAAEDRAVADGAVNDAVVADGVTRIATDKNGTDKNGTATNGAVKKEKGRKGTPIERVGAAELEGYLGPASFGFGPELRKDEVGVAYGLSVNEYGGDLIEVEATWMPGTDDRHRLTLTGQLGDVMQESVRAALSYARGRCREYGVTPDFFDRHALHVHVPAGAIPKDGPSAGITMTTTIVSALSGRPVRSDVAMTGEVTLRGRVLAIGGVKQKALAANRSGIKTLILPAQNKNDLADIPKDVRKGLRIIWVERVDEVLEHALLPVAVELPVPVELPEPPPTEVIPAQPVGPSGPTPAWTN
ncbi:MAG: endopeptidase La [Chloroflexota bacterium]|nr:endopeptidase La [Chloroflexota bacterium]